MRTIRMGVAVLVVTVGGLVTPGSAEACGVVFTAFSVYRDDIEVVASADAQVIESEPGSCSLVEYLQFPLELELETPQDILYDSDLASGSDWWTIEASVMVSVPIASYQGGFGWYDATAWIDYFRVDAPFQQTFWGPWYDECTGQCDYYVPTPALELSGPYSTQQNNGVYIYASLEPSFLVDAIDWEGCAPVQSDNSVCYFNAAVGPGPHVVTASLDGGPNDQWIVDVE